MNAVTADTVNVALCNSSKRHASTGSKRYNKTSGAPVSSASATWPTRPVTWNSGASPRITSALVRSIQRSYTEVANTTLRCVFIAPLGSPVVPEV